MAFKGKKSKEAEQSELSRRYKSKPLLYIGSVVFLAIVIVIFVLVPAIPDVGLGGGTDPTFGEYDRIPITYVPGNYFAQVQEYISRQRRNTMDEYNYQLSAYSIWREAFEETVVHTGVLQEMKRAGYAPPSETVDLEVAQLPDFQDNGRFSPVLYRAMDNARRISLWRDVEESIIERAYRADIANLQVSSKEGPHLSAMAARERSFDIAILPLSSYPDEEIVSFVQNNSDLFRVTHFLKITVTSSEREARQVLASIQDGTTSFEDAAIAHSKDAYADKGGDMGQKLAFELATEVPGEAERQAVLSLDRDSFSPVVKVPTGWAFFKCQEAAYPVNTTEEAQLSKIRAYMMEFERGRIEDWAFAQAGEIIALSKENGFDAALIMKSITKQSFGPLPLNFGGTDLFTSLASFGISELSLAQTNEEFWRAAFFGPLDTASEPITLGTFVAVLYPHSETIKDASETELIGTAYTAYWLDSLTAQSFRQFFLSSDKLEDHFDDTFIELFYSN